MPLPASLVLATRNPHKLQEFRRLLVPLGIGVEALGADVVLPPEDGDAFAENATVKARAAAAAAGRAAIADDSGIESEALGGAPGVYSARYAGPRATDAENLAKLRAQAPPGSALRYVCSLAFVDPGTETERIFGGECRGRLASAERGARGFGYDPAFLPDEDAEGRTMAELSDGAKDAISHRGRAVRAMVGWLACR
jgi:XTP/dITP diphosphohydrolase